MIIVSLDIYFDAYHNEITFMIYIVTNPRINEVSLNSFRKVKP